jgi:hypothetical protein
MGSEGKRRTYQTFARGVDEYADNSRARSVASLPEDGRHRKKADDPSDKSQPDDGRDYRRWLVNQYKQKYFNARKPGFVSKHKIAKALGVSVPSLKGTATHYLDEAYTIQRAEFEARREIAIELKILPHQVILPEF